MRLLRWRVRFAGSFSVASRNLERCEREEIDEMHILSSWIYHHRESLACLYMAPYSECRARGDGAGRKIEPSYPVPAKHVQSLCKTEGMG
jgi:hypothetical protein